MKHLFIPLFVFLQMFLIAKAQTVTGPKGEVFKVRVVANKLSDAWEVTYGPDNYLWITEAKGYKVSRIDPVSGSKEILLDLNEAKDFPRYDKIPDSVDEGKPWPQGGLMGLALHPRLLTGKPYVYLAYIYSFAGVKDKGKGCKENAGGCFFTTKIVRYNYDSAARILNNPIVLCDSIPAGNDHNSGRLLIAPVAGKNFLFYSSGELGAGQFDNAGRTNKAQNTNSYEGKIHRFNVEPDTDNNQYDKWIPNDNPFNNTKQSAVWSIGHRNAQGLMYAVIGGVGRIYSSEHGPFSDDEINIIEKGKNYGHPLVIGYNDGNYDGLAAGVTSNTSLPGMWHTAYPTIISERANALKIGKDYRNPIKTLYPNKNNFLRSILTQQRDDDKSNPEWPSEAPSSIDVYTSTAIPGWKNSLLIPTLKGGKLVRLQLNKAGTGVTGDTINYFKGKMRYRDIAISPDGTKIYLSVDSTSVSSGPSEENQKDVSYPGTILEFEYTGNTTGSILDKKRKATGNSSNEKAEFVKNYGKL